ncbi:GCN5-related N-acetyltransferas-like protein [Lindgomyces ingoldianus]|uniref:GCN5-related N-acetyltransferas-like protein n=1 Tax=Lindgomyces ingoldianus TaxID=673940 RepID=A0ACB6QIQ2_9PLEO|nr:GCN5-related N-acetyltransferas-like protein [Lindgomyces ingoldianus]KAF2466770.1 GCN5-related N-acetyltransferas-like protein [Lindgomyces ingoldianus]
MDSPLPEPITTTPRLIIRPLHPQDAPSMQLHASPASIAKYMTLAFPHPYTLDDARNWISRNTTHPLNSFTICLRTAPTIAIGGISLKPGEDVETHIAEVAFWVGEPYWGQGITTEALKAVTEWVFRERGERYRRLWARVCSGNWGSMRCFEKCGYRLEGVLKGHVEKHGEVRDVHIYGLTKRDWEGIVENREQGKD